MSLFITRHAPSLPLCPPFLDIHDALPNSLRDRTHASLITREHDVPSLKPDAFHGRDDHGGPDTEALEQAVGSGPLSELAHCDWSFMRTQPARGAHVRQRCA